MTRKSFKGRERAKEFLGLAHSDICGQLSSKIYCNKEYFIKFVDDYSKYAHVYLILRKFEAFEYFRRYKIKVEKQIGRDIKVLRTKKFGEYRSTEFDKYCNEKGMIRHMTMPYTPQQKVLRK